MSGWYRQRSDSTPVSMDFIHLFVQHQILSAKAIYWMMRLDSQRWQMGTIVATNWGSRVAIGRLRMQKKSHCHAANRLQGMAVHILQERNGRLPKRDFVTRWKNTQIWRKIKVKRTESGNINELLLKAMILAVICWQVNLEW